MRVLSAYPQENEVDKLKRRIYAILTAIIIFASVLPVNICFAVSETFGSCGNGITWALGADGTLTISGTGEIEDITSDTKAWKPQNANVKSIVIKSGITNIPSKAFENCVNVETVSIADTVTNIGGWAFNNCDSLTAVTLSKNVTYIGSNPFGDCDSLQQIKISNQNADYKAVNGILYSKDGTVLISFPNKAVYSDKVLENVETIYGGAFQGNTVIETIEFPKTVQKVGEKAFDSMKAIKSIKLNEGLTNVAYGGVWGGYGCFENCEALESVNIPSTLQRVPSFRKCTNLKNITFNGEPTVIETFNGCAELENIYIPDSIVSFAGTAAFGGCGKLKMIHLSNSLTNLPVGTFQGCVSLENIVLPDKLSEINWQSFMGCTNLKSIVIPKSVTSIGSNAFNNCDNLQTIYYTGTPEEWNAVEIASGNNAITYADIIYNYVPTSINLDKNEVSMQVGETLQLSADVSPENSSVQWTSDHENTATVSENGEVTAKAVGTAKITATANGIASASCTVEVVPTLPSGITLDKSEVSIMIGSSEKLTATVVPETVENKNVKWSSADSDVVSVDENGNITAKSIGTAVVTATTEAGGLTARCTVTVLPIAVSDITLDKTEISITEGTSVKVSASVFPENATDKTVLWSSNNENVATVEKGTITAVSQGTAVIAAKTKDGSHTAYCAVTVIAASVPVKSISLNQSTLTIVEGYTDTLTATISPSNATNKTITWSTNNSKVATVENGTVQAIAPGTAVIIATAEDSGQIATCIVNVKSSMQDSVSKPIASILSGAVKEGANVLLLCATRGAQIHYTTDGSAPTKDSPLYTEPIQINSAVKIKAIALKSGMLDSEVASFSYTIADPDIPYVSVQTNLTGNKGDFTTVSVNISENSGSAGGSFNLVYDNTAVELMSVENGSYISKANPIVNDTYANNKVRTVWAGSKKLEGGGEILTAQFRILDDTDKDTAYFSLEKLKIADDNAVKMKCVQSDGVLAIMTAESAVSDKEFVTEPILNSDNKTLSVTVTSNGNNTGKMYVAVYDTNNKLTQLKCTDVKNNEVPYDIVFDKEIVPGQCVKVFIWNSVMCPLSDVKMLYK